jgi:hypothetical protein
MKSTETSAVGATAASEAPEQNEQDRTTAPQSNADQGHVASSPEILNAWIAGYYHAGYTHDYTHDSAYAEKQAEEYARDHVAGALSDTSSSAASEWRPLACPFCGSEPTVEAYRVTCDHPFCEAQPNTAGQSQAEAIRAWNVRPSQEKP